MLHDFDQAQIALADRVKDAFETKTPLIIQGGGSKAFYGRPVVATPLSLSDYSGIINYEPSELVITARAGTRLSTIESVLAEQGQMLGFEPPSFSPAATIGGCIACGLSGPRRPYSGAARDFVLGATIINGRGEILKFGGQVMKNVAGYDVSRLMTGALGTLGVLLDISLKVIPKPAHEETLVLPYNHSQMAVLLSDLGRQPIPISGTVLHNDSLYLRLSGAKGGVIAAKQKIGGEVLSDPDLFWHQINEQRHPFFSNLAPLWRVSVAPAAPQVPAELLTDSLVEWGGALRWGYSDHSGKKLREWAIAQGGHATCFRNAPAGTDAFNPLSPGLFALSQRIKNSFDPHRILNPGRLYDGI